MTDYTLDSNDAIDYYNRGNDYRNKGQYDSAIEDYNKAIQLDPNLAQAYGNRGLTYLDKSQYDRAIEDFNKAVALIPDHPFAYINRALAHGHKGDYDRAIEDSNKAIALDPDESSAYINRALAYSSKGENDRAIEDCNKALALDPNNANAYNFLSELKAKGRVKSSVESKSYVSRHGGIMFSRDFDQSQYVIKKAIIRTLEKIGYKHVGGSDYGDSGLEIRFRESGKWGFWNNLSLNIVPQSSDSCTVIVSAMAGGETLAEKLFEAVDEFL